MASNVTLETLRSRVLWRADAVGDANLDVSPYTLLDILINVAAKELYDEILSAFGDDYYTSTPAIVPTTTAGVGYLALPSDFYKLRGVAANIGGKRVALERCNWNEREQYNEADSWANYWNVPRYYDKAARLYFVPPPDGIYSIYVDYVPVCPTLAAGAPGVPFDGINGWDEYIVLRTAIMILNREESDSSALQGELAHITQRIRQLADSRDIGRPHKVHDVVGEREDNRILRWYRR